MRIAFSGWASGARTAWAALWTLFLAGRSAPRNGCKWLGQNGCFDSFPNRGRGSGEPPRRSRCPILRFAITTANCGSSRNAEKSMRASRSQRASDTRMWNLFVINALYAAMVLGASLWARAQSAAPPMSNNPIQAADFGFACNFDNPAACRGASWITTVSQPGTIRLHDSGTTWQRLTAGPEAYKWTNLDLWLDAIAAHQPRTVLFTFNRVPCWDVREARS